MIKKLKSGPWPIFILSSFSSVANLYLPIFLARTMSPEQMGIYKIFFLYIGAIPFLFLAGGPLNSVYYWVGKPEKERLRYLQQCFILGIILSTAILITCLPLQSQIAEFTNLSSKHVLFMLFGAFVAVPGSYYAETKVALGQTIKGSLYDTSFEFIKVIIFIGLAYYTRDIETVFIAFCAIFGFKFMVSTALKFKDGLVSFRPEKSKLKEIWFYCLPISLSGLITFTMDKIDQFVLAAQLRPDDFAFYSMGCLIVPPLYLLEMSVSRVLIPKLSSNDPSLESEKLQHFKKAVSDTALLIIPGFFGLWIFSEQIVKLLYTDKFLESAQFLKFFAISYLFLLMPYDAIPRATGKTKMIFNLTLIFGVFSVLAIILTSKNFGALEVLLVSLVFKFGSRFAGIVYSSKVMNWKLREMIPWKQLTTFTGTCFLLGLSCKFTKTSFESDMNWFFVCGPAFAVFYFVLLAIPYKKRKA